MFWICDEKSVDSTGMFYLWLNGTNTESRAFLSLTPPHQWAAGGAQWVGKGHSWDSQCQMAKGWRSSSHSIRRHTQRAIHGKEEVRGHLEWGHFSSQVTTTCGGSLIFWKWLSTCLSNRKWQGNSFFCFACSCLQKQFLLYLLNAISTHEFSHLHTSEFSSHPRAGSEREVLWAILSISKVWNLLQLQFCSISPPGACCAAFENYVTSSAYSVFIHCTDLAWIFYTWDSSARKMQAHREISSTWKYTKWGQLMSHSSLDMALNKLYLLYSPVQYNWMCCWFRFCVLLMNSCDAKIMLVLYNFIF